MSSDDEITNNFDYLVKIVIIGNSNVGKTALLTRYLSKTFETDPKPTIGIDTNFQILQKQKNRIKINFCDTAGQERYRSLTAMSYKDANAIILVYDITNRKSYEEKKFWLKSVFENSREKIKILLIGNKRDLKNERCVTVDEASAFAREEGLYFFETSAKLEESDCVERAFAVIVDFVVEEEVMREGVLEDEEFRRTRMSSLQINKPQEEGSGGKCC